MRSLSPAALEALTRFDWPGNVRQLRNTIERVCALGRGPVAEVEDLPPDIVAGVVTGVVDDAPAPTQQPAGVGEPFQEMKARKVAAIESSYLIALLGKHEGNVTRSAEEAGMSRSALQKIMQRYGIKSSDYRR